MEELLADFYEEIATKLSLDEETISANAFELFTRAKGVKAPVAKLF